MPFIAIDQADGRPRIPVGVEDDEEVECPVCGGVMRVRGGDYRARHFYHPRDSGGSCETPLHFHMKSVAVAKLEKAYPKSTVDIEIRANEVPRRADVYVEFDQPQFPLGRGIAVEVQHLNDQKDITATTADYLTDERSVMWLFEENYAGTRPEYEDVELPSPIPVWPFAVPQANTTSENTPSEDFLGITEADLLDVLPNHINGQVSLAEFPSEPDTSEGARADELSEWSRKKEIHLNLSITTPGAREVYRSWLKAVIESDLEDHRNGIRSQWSNAKLESRYTYLGERFFDGDTDTFEFSIEVHPTKSGKFYIRKFSEGEKHEIESPTTEDVVKSFTELVTQVCYEMECSREKPSSGPAVTKPVESSLCDFSYSITRGQGDLVVIEFEEPEDPYSIDYEPTELTVEFCDEHIPALLEICKKVLLWYDISYSVQAAE